MKLYNTLTRSLESFDPLDKTGRTVGMYACGPTVYDEPHLGHVRSTYVFDLLRRYLEFKGFRVRFVRNVTDVDDKIIEKARQEQGTGNLNDTCRAVAEKYLNSYHEALERLGVGRPTNEPRAMEHVVPDMTDFIAQLLVNGVAYEAGGDVYFAVRKFPGYGALSNRTLDELQAGARVEPGEQKQDPLDFALWKTAKPDEPSWNSPWGKGRPGWHIECSVMSTKLLGDAFDIHGGGVDLVFPHHENEIAQAQALGKPFARYWVHHGLMTVNGEKMSKSAGRFVTVDEALNQCGGEADVLKVFFLGTHYRSPIDYTATNLQAAAKRFSGLFHLSSFAQVRRTLADLPPTAPAEIATLQHAFECAMDDDLNTPGALAVLDKLANLSYQWEADASTAGPKEERAARALRGKMVFAARTIRELGQTLGLFSHWVDPAGLTSEDEELIRRREDARKRRDFHTADRIRKELLEKKGLIIEDTADGPVVLPKR